jgi:hypothetical protein
MVGINTLHFVAESLEEGLYDVLGGWPIGVKDRTSLLKLYLGELLHILCSHRYALSARACRTQSGIARGVDRPNNKSVMIAP